MKYNIKCFLVLILAQTGCAFGLEITVSGVIKNTNGDPIATSVVAVQPSKLLPGGNPTEKFVKLARTRSDPTTGTFSIKFNNSGVERVVIAAWHKKMDYYIYAELSDFQKNSNSFDIVVPVQKAEKKSVEFIIKRNGVEIDYKKESYVVALMEIGENPLRNFVNLTTKDLIIFSNKSLFNLPDGVYNLQCKVAHKKNDAVEVSEVITTLVLPLANDDKIFTINLVSP